jgi:outer membrane biosynthesis protein TonB
MKSIEHDDLVAAAEELNELMFEEGEGIDVEASDKKITAGVLEAAKELTPDDKLSKGVKATLIAMNAIEEEEEEEKKEEKPAKKSTKKTTPAKEEEEPEEPEEETPPAKKTGGKKEVKKTEVEKDAPKTKRTGGARTGIVAKSMEFFIPLVEKAKFTKNELIEKALVKFPNAKRTTLATLLQDGKNPKYNKFPKLMYQHPETKIYSFNKK